MCLRGNIHIQTNIYVMIAGTSGLILGLLIKGAMGATLDEEQIRSMAAEQDLSFFSAFLSDFGSNYQSYTSYMAENSMRLPQEVMDYYNHLAQLPQTADLQQDIASSFPFTQFQTFVTEFPWYTSLLEDAGASTIYMPEYFESYNGSTIGSNGTSFNETVGNLTHTGNITADGAGISGGNAPESASSTTSKVSHNNAAQNGILPVAVLGALALLL